MPLLTASVAEATSSDVATTDVSVIVATVPVATTDAVDNSDMTRSIELRHEELGASLNLMGYFLRCT